MNHVFSWFSVISVMYLFTRCVLFERKVRRDLAILNRKIEKIVAELHRSKQPEEDLNRRLDQLQSMKFSPMKSSALRRIK